jgi:hypothetical protein
MKVIKSRTKRWKGHVACIVTTRNAYKMLSGKPEGIKLRGRSRGRWENIIKMDIKSIVRMRIGFVWLRMGSSGGLL